MPDADKIGSNNGQMNNFSTPYGISSESNWSANGFIKTKLYIDGQCNSDIDLGNGLDYVSGSMAATIGALAIAPSASVSGPALGWGKLNRDGTKKKLRKRQPTLDDYPDDNGDKKDET